MLGIQKHGPSNLLTGVKRPLLYGCGSCRRLIVDAMQRPIVPIGVAVSSLRGLQ